MARGVFVGDTKEKVIELYGEPDEDWKNQYWTDDLDSLGFTIEDGLVTRYTIDFPSSRQESWDHFCL